MTRNKTTENKAVFKTTENRAVFKPFSFDWAVEATLTQMSMHWLPQEIDMSSDLQDFSQKLTDTEREIIIKILRFFTQTDLEVGRVYTDYYIPNFACPEIRMM